MLSGLGARCALPHEPGQGASSAGTPGGAAPTESGWPFRADISVTDLYFAGMAWGDSAAHPPMGSSVARMNVNRRST